MESGKKSVRENTGNLEILPNTGNLVCSSCKFPDSKGKRYFRISNLLLKVNKCQVSQLCVRNSHKSRKLAQKICGQTEKMEFENEMEWIPCSIDYIERVHHR